MIKKKKNEFIESKLLSDNNYKQIQNLEKFLTEQSKIVNRRTSKLPIRQHQRMTKELKRGRLIGLLPFTTLDN